MRALTLTFSRLKQQKRQFPSEDQSDTSSGSQSETAKTGEGLLSGSEPSLTHTHQSKQNAALLITAMIKLVQPN